MSAKFFINRNFSLLWTASFISQTGDMIYAIALAWLILERTKSPAMMGLFLVASYLPGFLISPWAGAVIDRPGRKRLLIVADVLRGAAVVAAAFVVQAGKLQMEHVLGVAVLLSVCSAFFNPAARVVLPRLVPGDQLVPANANMQLISGITSIAGPLLGAALIGFIGYPGAFLSNGISFLLSGGLIACIRGSLDSETAEAEPGSEGGIGSGFRFLAGDSRLAIILVIIFCVHLFFGSLAVLMPFLANALPGTGVSNLGMLEAALGAGIVAGSLLLKTRGQEPRESALFKAIALMGTAILAMGACQAFGWRAPLAYGGSMLVIGVCVSLASVFWTTRMQRSVPNPIAGRIFALASAAGNIALPLAYGLFGLLLGSFSLKSIFLACGVAIALIGLLAGAADAAAARPDSRSADSSV